MIMKDKINNTTCIETAEMICALSVAMCVNGIFALDPDYAYSGGNSTYLSIPLSASLSLLFILCVLRVMSICGCDDLYGLFKYAFGRKGAIIISIPTAISLTAISACPLASFMQVLHRLVFDGASYFRIFVFVFPVVCLMAFKGIGAITRTSGLIVVPLFVSLLAAVVSSLQGFEVYRLYPVVGDGVRHMFSFAGSSMLYFAAPLSVLLIEGRVMQGAGVMRKTAVRSTLISAGICAAAHLAVSMSFGSKTLSQLLMPLYRIGFVNPKPWLVMRLDKAFIMIWLSGAIMGSSFCIMGASDMLTCSLGEKKQKAVTASVCLISALIVLKPMLLELDSIIMLGKLVSRYAVILTAVPVAAAAAFAAIKNKRRTVG